MSMTWDEEITVTTPRKCVSCREVKPAFKAFVSTTHYASYHRTNVRVTYWCEQCWTNHVANEERGRQEAIDKVNEVLKANGIAPVEVSR